MNLVDEQNAHRAAVEAGYASLPGYLEKWPSSASQVSEWTRNHVAIAERHAAAGPRWVDDDPPLTSDQVAYCHELADARRATWKAHAVNSVDFSQSTGKLTDMSFTETGHFPRPIPARKGDWMQTASGRQFWPLDPRTEEIYIEDIAAALSKLCRYGGHCKRFYSVAEHCVLMAHAAPDELRLAALMHDASEAYLSDVIRPIKRHMPQFGIVEIALERMIAIRFNLEWPLLAEVKRLDERIVHDEKAQIMLPSLAHDPCVEAVPALGVTIQFWTPEKAEFEFLAAFRRYGGHWC